MGLSIDGWLRPGEKPLIIQREQTQKEKGVALVMVLGIVAMVSAWAATAAYEDMISLRRAENMQNMSRAWMASESVVALARLYLKADAKENSTDHLDEIWAMPVPPLPVDEGMVSAELMDANRYLNINELVDDKGVAQETMIKTSKRLFEQLELPTSLIDKLVDWMDKDDQPRPAGAEDTDYYNQSYRVKNARLDRFEELALIDGFDAEIVHVLKEHIIIRPSSDGLTKININTASKDVLMALFPEMMDADAEALIEQRPFEQVSDATADQIWLRGGDLNRLSVSSDAFIVRTQALFDRVSWREEYLVARNNGKTQVLSRHRLGWGN